MSKHTSGPWHVSKTGFSRKQPCPTVYAADDELRYIAFCDDGLNFGNATDNLANAHLIAAAPDLYEACLQALTHIEVDETTHGRNFAAGNVIRAAIAKASPQSERE